MKLYFFDVYRISGRVNNFYFWSKKYYITKGGFGLLGDEVLRWTQPENQAGPETTTMQHIINVQKRI